LSKLPLNWEKRKHYFAPWEKEAIFTKEESYTMEFEKPVTAYRVFEDISFIYTRYT
jgi:hypothetical protein